MTTLTFTDAIRVAISRVGLRPEDVVDVLGSCLEGDEVHLVGSLAAGLGNAESDIDLHVLVDEAAPGVVPMLFFAGRTRLDLVQIDATAPRTALAKLPTDTVALARGRCALGQMPDMTDMKRLSRWATAVPMYDTASALFDDVDRAAASAALVRLALDVSVRSATLAGVAEAAGSSFAPLAWSRAAEAAVEAVARSAGQIFIGDKWLSAKVREAGLPWSLLAGARRVHDAPTYDAFVDAAGLALRDPSSLARVELADGPTFTFGARSFQLAGGRLVPPLELASASVADALATQDAKRLLASIVAGAATVAVDAGLLDARLR